MAPRDHGKSICLARAYPIWKAKYDPHVKDIMILGSDQASASENLDKLKDLILATPSLQSLIPEDRKNYFNSKTAIKLSNGVIIRARSFTSALRGRHPQLIVLDDVLNEANSNSKDMRAALKKRFFEVIYPMRDRGSAERRRKGFVPQIVIVGTAQDREDLYHDLLKSPGFFGRKQRAVLDYATETVLWPERYPYDVLMNIKRIQGTLTFSKEYQNEPLTEETSIFPPSLFAPLYDKELSYSTKYHGVNPVFLGADFSVPGVPDGDYTVVFALEYDPHEQLFTPLSYWRKQAITIEEQVRAIIQMCADFKVTNGLLEANSFQRIYAEHFRNRTTLPLSGHVVTARGKNSSSLGLLSLRTLFENGRFRLPYKTDRDKTMTDQIVLEFNGITKKGKEIGNFTYHDDTPMAIWHAVHASRGGSDFGADVLVDTDVDSGTGLPIAAPNPEDILLGRMMNA